MNPVYKSRAADLRSPSEKKREGSTAALSYEKPLYYSFQNALRTPIKYSTGSATLIRELTMDVRDQSPFT